MNTHNYVISYYAIRQLIGILGLLLPFLCWAINGFVNHFDLLNDPRFVDLSQSAAYHPGLNLKSSISHFYYTTAGPLFTGILVTVAVFLFCYNGHPLKKNDDRFAWLTDKRLTVFAAICALGIVIFPTGSEEKITDNIHIYVSSKGAGNVHFIFAALFFLSIAILSIINFRRQPGKKVLRGSKGTLFLICGWGMITCLLLLFVYSIVPYRFVHWLPYYFVYLMEVIMLLLFATAWLVKGKSIPTEYILNKLEKA